MRLKLRGHIRDGFCRSLRPGFNVPRLGKYSDVDFVVGHWLLFPLRESDAYLTRRLQEPRKILHRARLLIQCWRSGFSFGKEIAHRIITRPFRASTSSPSRPSITSSPRHRFEISFAENIYRWVIRPEFYKLVPPRHRHSAAAAIPISSEESSCAAFGDELSDISVPGLAAVASPDASSPGISKPDIFISFGYTSSRNF